MLNLKKYILSVLESKKIHRGDIHRNDRYGALYKAWGHIYTNHMEGDYAEFGVYRGQSMADSYSAYKQFEDWISLEYSQGGHNKEEWRKNVAAKFVNNRPVFHGFDTFGGMPSNDEGNVSFEEGTYLSNIDDVRAKILNSGMPKEQLELYKGLFSESKEAALGNFKRKLAIVNIDCDLYISTKDVFDIIKDHIQVGTVLLFDDYNDYCADNSQGERRAFREFQEESEFTFEPWFSYLFSGQAFLCTGKK
jgi:hypothetical protein